MRRALEAQGDVVADLKRKFSRVGREIENLLRAIEIGAASAVLLDRLQERERERALQAQLPTDGSGRGIRSLDIRRIRRVLEDGLAPLGGVLDSDPVAARQGLGTILDGKVRFTPIDLAGGMRGMRTYRFEAKLMFGVLGATRQNGVDVPDGICTLLFPDFQVLTTVKQAA